MRMVAEVLIEKRQMPTWLKKHCSAADLERITKTVQQAEKNTAGEIVPMIVHSSISRSHISQMLFLLLSLLGVLFLDFWLSFHDQLVDLYGASAVLLVAGLTSWILKDSDLIAALLTSKKEMQASSLRRAQLEFFHSELNTTKYQTGFLIFVSLLEKRVVVLGDEAIAKVIPQSEWDALVQDLVSQVKVGKFTDGMCKAVTHAGEILQKSFPAPSENNNELSDHLVVKE